VYRLEFKNDPCYRPNKERTYPHLLKRGSDIVVQPPSLNVPVGQGGGGPHSTGGLAESKMKFRGEGKKDPTRRFRRSRKKNKGGGKRISRGALLGKGGDGWLRLIRAGPCEE